MKKVHETKPACGTLALSDQACLMLAAYTRRSSCLMLCHRNVSLAEKCMRTSQWRAFKRLE